MVLGFASALLEKVVVPKQVGETLWVQSVWSEKEGSRRGSRPRHGTVASPLNPLGSVNAETQPLPREEESSRNWNGVNPRIAAASRFLLN